MARVLRLRHLARVFRRLRDLCFVATALAFPFSLSLGAKRSRVSFFLLLMFLLINAATLTEEHSSPKRLFRETANPLLFSGRPRPILRICDRKTRFILALAKIKDAGSQSECSQHSNRGKCRILQ